MARVTDTSFHKTVWPLPAWQTGANLKEYKMKEQKYKVRLIFKYSDTVHVVATDEKEAISKALDVCHEEYECFYDAEVDWE